jgi:hypothetical protein
MIPAVDCGSDFVVDSGLDFRCRFWWLLSVLILDLILDLILLLIPGLVFVVHFGGCFWC